MLYVNIASETKKGLDPLSRKELARARGTPKTRIGNGSSLRLETTLVHASAGLEINLSAGSSDIGDEIVTLDTESQRAPPKAYGDKV